MDALFHMLILPRFYTYILYFYMQKAKFPPNHAGINQGVVQHVHMKGHEKVKNGKYF